MRVKTWERTHGGGVVNNRIRFRPNVGGRTLLAFPIVSIPATPWAQIMRTRASFYDLGNPQPLADGVVPDKDGLIVPIRAGFSIIVAIQR